MVADLIVSSVADLIPGSENFLQAVGDFFGDFGKDLAKDYMKEGVGSFVKAWQSEQVSRRIKAARQRLKDETGFEPQPVSPSIGLPLLNAASLEDRPELTQMWERLLSAAMNKDKASGIRQVYIDILKQMDPLDALVFAKLSFNGENNSRNKIAQEISRNPSQVDISFANLVDFRCCRFAETQSHQDGTYSHTHLTSLGRELQQVLNLPTK